MALDLGCRICHVSRNKNMLSGSVLSVHASKVP